MKNKKDALWNLATKKQLSRVRMIADHQTIMWMEGTIRGSVIVVATHNDWSEPNVYRIGKRGGIYS